MCTNISNMRLHTYGLLALLAILFKGTCWNSVGTQACKATSSRTSKTRSTLPYRWDWTRHNWTEPELCIKHCEAFLNPLPKAADHFLTLTITPSPSLLLRQKTVMPGLKDYTCCLCCAKCSCCQMVQRQISCSTWTGWSLSVWTVSL